jgi:hypothetical protein
MSETVNGEEIITAAVVGAVVIAGAVAVRYGMMKFAERGLKKITEPKLLERGKS